MILLESPWPILLIGIAVEAVLAVALLRTGQGKVLWAMLGVGALVLTGLLIERLVVTEREAVEHTLDAAIDAVEANDINRLLECISPKAEPIRAAARMVLGRVEVRMARMTGLEITINRLTNPHTAKAKFRAIGSGRDRKGELPSQGFSEVVTVELRPEGGRWLVFDYKPENPNLR
jgi:hypothetical protein